MSSLGKPTLLEAIPDEIVVYQNKAKVRRMAAIPVSVVPQEEGKAFEACVAVALPKCFDRDSIQVEFNEALAGCATLDSVMVNRIPHEEQGGPAESASNSSSQRSVDIQKRLEELPKELKAVKIDLEAQACETEFLNKMAERVLSGENDDLLGYPDTWKSKTWEKMIESLEASRKKNGDEIFALETKSKKLKAELETLKRDAQRLNRTISSEKEQRERVVILLSITRPAAVEEGTLKLFVSYMIPNASWEAVYECFLNTSTKTLRIAYGAKVRVRQGEDFPNVRLTLCSTAPRMLKKEQELNPWRCGLEAPQLPEPRANALAYTFADSAPVMPVRLGAAPVEMDREGGIVNFTLSKLASLKADGEPRRFSLVSIDVPVTMKLTSIPALDQSVYTSAEGINESEYLLLPGKVALFLDGEYVSQSFLSRAAPGKTISVDFGVDRSIELKRVLLSENAISKRKGFTWSKDTSTRSFLYRSVIRNLKSIPVTVLLKEKVPKASEAEIKVKLVEPERFATEDQKALFDSQGRVEMLVDIPPNSFKDVYFGFMVEWPLGKSICGLDDRH